VRWGRRATESKDGAGNASQELCPRAQLDSLPRVAPLRRGAEAAEEQHPKGSRRGPPSPMVRSYADGPIDGADLCDKPVAPHGKVGLDGHERGAPLVAQVGNTSSGTRHQHRGNVMVPALSLLPTEVPARPRSSLADRQRCVDIHGGSLREDGR
jgi:hypothetical protein